MGDKALKASAKGDEEVLAKVGALNDKSQAQTAEAVSYTHLPLPTTPYV